MQENWIGKSRGLQFRFRLADAVGEIDAVEVFTTRPDTIFGASFVAVAADHPIALAVAATNAEAVSFIADCKAGGTSAAELETMEKNGFRTGVEVVHPLNPDWRLPVYIANFVLMDYGTGAIFGVPGHDQRDFEFAKQYHLPIPRVVADNRWARVRTDWNGSGKWRRDRGEFPVSRWTDDRAGREGGHPARRSGRLGPWHRAIPPAGLGRLPTALLGHADPDHPLRGLWRGSGPARSASDRPAGRCQLRHPRQPARPSPDLEAGRLPKLRR